MKRQQVAAIVSVAVHGGFIAAFTGIAAFSVPYVNTVTIDFSMDKTQPVQSTPQALPAEPPHKKAISRAAVKEESFPDTTREEISNDTVEFSDEDPGEVEDSAVQSVSVEPAVAPLDTGLIIEKERRKYLKEQFEYIRRIIYRKAEYPSIAIQMNITGTVFLSFCVSEDGGVEKVDIIRSSGALILDRDAVSTIRRAAPFPRPPVRVVVNFPMEYRLE
jgi:protein TonB